MKKRIPKKYLKVWIAFVNINAEDRSGSAIIVMPNNGEKKHIAYKEEIDELRETITQLQNRIEELENKNK